MMGLGSDKNLFNILQRNCEAPNMEASERAAFGGRVSKLMSKS